MIEATPPITIIMSSELKIGKVFFINDTLKAIASIVTGKIPKVRSPNNKLLNILKNTIFILIN